MLGGEAGSELRAVAQTAAVSDVGPAESLLVEQVHEYARYGACTANGRKRDGSPACCVAAPGVAMSWSLNYRKERKTRRKAKAHHRDTETQRKAEESARRTEALR